MRGELGEPDRIPELARGRRAPAGRAGASASGGTSRSSSAPYVSARRHPLRLEEHVELPRLLGPLAARRRQRTCVPQARVAQHPPEVAARLRVEGDIRDARPGRARARSSPAARRARPPGSSRRRHGRRCSRTRRAARSARARRLAQDDIVQPDLRRRGADLRRSAPRPGRRRARGCRASPRPSPSGCRRPRIRPPTRARVNGSGGSSPCRIATVARRSGCVCAYGKLEYRTSS